MQDAIRDFWKWWETARHRVLAAIDNRDFPEALVDDIAQHVAAIDPELDWELCAGTTSLHAFCVSAKGDTQLRVVTELWRSLGPAPDETWQYYAARQPRSGTTLVYEDVELASDKLLVAFEVDEVHKRVHGTYYHPGFRAIENAGPPLFLLLDGVFGEDGVERWLGGIEVATEEPEGAQPIAAVQAIVDRMTAEVANGPRYAMLEGTAEGAPIFFVLNLALKRIDHLLHTTHVAVEMAVLERGENGMPSKEDMGAMAALEEELKADVGNHAVYFGRGTTPNERTLFWYMPEDSAARSAFDAWVAKNRARNANVTFRHDPKWQFVKQF